MRCVPWSKVLVEMDDDGIVIPRNSLVEANQSGLIADTIIDITPEIPIPNAQWGPLDSGCEGEGLVVCDRGKIIGVPGVSMDELVRPVYSHHHNQALNRLLYRLQPIKSRVFASLEPEVERKSDVCE